MHVRSNPIWCLSIPAVGFSMLRTLRPKPLSASYHGTFHGRFFLSGRPNEHSLLALACTPAIICILRGLEGTLDLKTTCKTGLSLEQRTCVTLPCPPTRHCREVPACVGAPLYCMVEYLFLLIESPHTAQSLPQTIATPDTQTPHSIDAC